GVRPTRVGTPLPQPSPQWGGGARCALPDHRDNFTEEYPMNPQIKYVTLSTRVTVEYIENGALAGTPLLLLHGLSDSWHSVLPLLPHLPRTVRALAFTQRGHGHSGKPRADYSLD